jgi:hypothetical protein
MSLLRRTVHEVAGLKPTHTGWTPYRFVVGAGCSRRKRRGYLFCEVAASQRRLTGAA